LAADTDVWGGDGQLCPGDDNRNGRESGPKKLGAIYGGFFPKKPDWPAQYPSLVIAVNDIQAAMRQVTDAGGKVLGEPLEIPGVRLIL
jgi:predicted enzyme related to lactoylglutathione lyase